MFIANTRTSILYAGCFLLGFFNVYMLLVSMSYKSSLAKRIAYSVASNTHLALAVTLQFSLTHTLILFATQAIVIALSIQLVRFLSAEHRFRKLYLLRRAVSILRFIETYPILSIYLIYIYVLSGIT